jgi:hypothetical protein
LNLQDSICVLDLVRHFTFKWIEIKDKDSLYLFVWKLMRRDGAHFLESAFVGFYHLSTSSVNRFVK